MRGGNGDRHASLVEACPDWLLTTDAAGLVTGMNPAAEEAFGAPGAGMPVRGLVALPWPPPRDRVRAVARLADGSAREVEAVVRPLPRRPGEFACFLRETPPAAEDRAARLEAVLESTDDGMVAVGPDGGVGECSRRLLALWGLPPGSEAGPAEALFARMAERVREPAHELLRPSAMLADARAEVSGLVELADGRVFQVSCRWERPAPPARRIWWFRDVTPWFKAEAELTERNRRIALGNDVGAAVVAGGTLREVLQRCAEAVLEHLDGAFARVWLLDETQNVLTLEASAGLHTGTTGRYARIPMGEAKIGRIAQTRVPHLTNDLLNDPLLREPEWARRTGMTSFAGYPMVFDDRVVGVMAMFADRPLSPTVLDALRGCAERLATAVARAWSEAEVRESEQRFRLLSEAALEGIVVHGHGVLVDANASFARLLGYDPSEIPGRPVGDFLQLTDASDDAGPGWHEQPRELLGRHRDGSTVPLEVSARSISRGGQELWVLVIRDLSERKHLEEQTLQLASERVARTRAGFLAQASQVLASSLDRQAVVAATARLAVPTLASFAIVLPLDDGRVSGAVAAHPDPESEAALCAAAARLDRWPADGLDDARALAAPGGVLAELRRQLPPELEPRSLVCLPLNASGAAMGLLVLGSSGPEREVDPATLGLAEELAYRAGSALENARLFAAAVQATRARDDMMGIVAHDLRNPLSLIASAAELIADGVFAGNPAGEQRHLQIIRRAAGQMNRLIADLLDARRIESGSMGVEVRAERPELLVAEALTFLGPLAEANGLHLGGAADEDLPAVWADPGRVQQVLSNLVGNAIKFTPRGGTIRLSATRCGDAVRVGVTDSGPGIPPEQVAHLFTRFWQADSGDRRGIGLGLSIARAIVEAHGGQIWVESQPGAGATFYFTLPLALDQRAGPDAGCAPLEPRASP
jgi:PAS domain S-box-containing protein